MVLVMGYLKSFCIRIYIVYRGVKIGLVNFVFLITFLVLRNYIYALFIRIQNTHGILPQNFFLEYHLYTPSYRISHQGSWRLIFQI